MIALYVVLALLALLLIYYICGIIAAKLLLCIDKRPFGLAARRQWAMNIPFETIFLKGESVSITTTDKILLKGQIFMNESPTKKWVILLHGYGSTNVSCFKYAKCFLDLGYNVLAPDNRNAGESGGTMSTFGFYESMDVEKWMFNIYAMDKDAEIGLYGVSLGAATAIMTASVRPDLKFLISYCSYSSWNDILKDRMKVMVGGFLSVLLLPAIKMGIYRISKALVGEVRPTRDIVYVKCPIMVLHSKKDDFTPIEHARRIHAAKPDIEYYEFEEGGHAKAYAVNPELYTSILSRFVKKL